MIQIAISKLATGDCLSSEELDFVINEIDKATPAQLGALIAALHINRFDWTEFMKLKAQRETNATHAPAAAEDDAWIEAAAKKLCDMQAARGVAAQHDAYIFPEEFSAVIRHYAARKEAGR